MTFAPIKGKPTATPPRVSKPIPLGLGHWYPAWRTHSIFGNIVIARYKSVSLVMKWSFLYTQYTTGKHPVNIFWELWGVCVCTCGIKLVVGGYKSFYFSKITRLRRIFVLLGEPNTSFVFYLVLKKRNWKIKLPHGKPN